MKHFKQHIKRRLLFSFVLISATVGGLKAQISSYAGLELHKLGNFWQQGYNPAGAWLDNPLKYSKVGFDVNYTDGTYHRAMDAEAQRDIKFNSEGVVLLDNHYISGTFNYINRNLKDVGYNASLIDPYRGMPYIVADLNSSDWKNQYYDMGVRWASPKLFNKLYVGVDFYYGAHSGAKQRDVRADNRLMQLTLRPGIVWSINKKNHLGGFFNYYSIKEESANSNVNTYISQEYYELNGLGNAVKQLGSGRSTNYTGNNFGGGVNYGAYFGATHLLFSTMYNLKAEKAEDSFTTPRDVGSVRDATWNTSLQLYTRSFSDFGHLLTVDYSLSAIKGIEYITQRTNSQENAGWVSLYSSVRSKYNTQRAALTYSLIAHRGNEYAWTVEMGINYQESKDKYLDPRSEKKSKNLRSHALFKRNIAFNGGKKPRLLLTGEALYNKNLSGSFNYGGKNSDYITVQNIELVDFQYYNTNYWGANAAVNYSQRVNSSSNMSWFVNGYFNYTKADKFEFNHRKTIGVAVGCIF